MKLTRSGALALGAVLATSVAVGVSPPANADPVDCAFSVALPSKVSVGQAVVPFAATLSYLGTPDCTDEFAVSTDLVNSTDDMWLEWDRLMPGDSYSPTYKGSIDAYEIVPGTYRITAPKCSTTAVQGEDETQLTCSVAPSSTVIKFAGHTTLRATRGKGKWAKTVTLTARSTHFDEFEGQKDQSATVRIQRYSNHRWHTVHTARTKASTGTFTWRHGYPRKAKYRAVSSATGAAWASTSKAVTK